VQNTFLTALGASLSAAAVTTLGIWTIRHFAAWGHRNTSYFMSFAAGVLVSASFLHLIPEALARNDQAPAWVLGGFLALHLFNRALTGFLCDRDPDAEDCTIGLIPMLGIGFHSFIDGFVYSIAFTVSVFTGFLATAGMILHEFPEGIVTYLLLVRGGFGERRATLLAFLAAAATTPAGMLIAWPLVHEIRGETLGSLLGLSAGALVYVGATHLLPHAAEDRKPYHLPALGGGVLLTVLIVLTRH
jgi:zinc and cadmium transporter